MSSWWLAMYCLLGPVAWVGIYAGFLLARSRMSRLREPTQPLPDPAPPVTILIPAKDEGAGIEECVRRVLSLVYPDFRVVAIDDRSSDQTGAVLDRLAAEHPDRLRVLHVTALPDGWLGKNHALHLGTRDVTTPWLLFIDSDVLVEPSALREVMCRAIHRGYDLVSLLLALRTETFWERLLLPLAGLTWATTFSVSLTNDDGLPNTAVGNGQFFLVKREFYEQAGGHAAVRDCVNEDVELARAVKKARGRVRLFSGFHLGATRMHTTLSQIMRGWGRIFAGTSRRKPWPMLAAMLFILVSTLSGYVALGVGIMQAQRGDAAVLSVAAVHLLMMHAYVAFAYGKAGVPRRYHLLLPLGATMMLGVLGVGVRRCFGGSFEWRGTVVRDHGRSVQG
jgi:hypothetical protein